jgi:hypothetical protein
VRLASEVVAREFFHTDVARPSASYWAVVTTWLASVDVRVSPRSGSSVELLVWATPLTVGWVTVCPVVR